MLDVDLIFKQKITNVKGFEKKQSSSYYEYTRLFNGHEECLWKENTNDSLYVRHQIYHDQLIEGIFILYTEII